MAARDGQRRLTWGGLMRMIGRRGGSSFSHDHIYMVTPDGHRRWLNIKFDVDGRPYFIEVRDHRRQG